MDVKRSFNGQGYWAVVLGGSSGIGLATVQKLATEGMHICLVHRDRRKDLPFVEAQIQLIRKCGVKCVSFNGDATRYENITTWVTDLKNQMEPTEKIRVLVHSLSRGNLKPLTGQRRLSRTDLALTMDAMALCLLDWVQFIHDQSCFANDARVLAFTSEGNRKSWKGYGAVSAAKQALEALCRSIALEFAPAGIRCNVIQPGVTDTPSFRMIPGHEYIAKISAQRNPFGRLTVPNDIANVVYLLCRDEASWINGALIPADGGEKNA
jgi:enoyl-[acyl-carrier protein] reductase I